MNGMTLTEFLLARIAEDEGYANAALTIDGAYPAWDVPTSGVVQTAGGDLDGLVHARRYIAHHIAHWHPSRVLAECEVKRGIAEHHRHDGGRCLICNWSSPSGCPTVRWLALPYANHPDYLEEWRP